MFKFLEIKSKWYQMDEHWTWRYDYKIELLGCLLTGTVYIDDEKVRKTKLIIFDTILDDIRNKTELLNNAI